MERRTRNAEQLKRLYGQADGRQQGAGRWAKLPFFWFSLFLSYKCTRRCSYCYSFNQVGDGNVDEMDERTFARLLEWIPEVWRQNQVKVNAIVFLGGEPLLRTDRIRRVMDMAHERTDGMQGHVYTNGDLVDSVQWDDLRDIQWITMNVTDLPLDELERRMKVVTERSNVTGQTLVATLDDFNLERALDLTRFGLERGHRLRFYRNLYRGVDAEYKQRLLRRYRDICDLLEAHVARGGEAHTTFLFDTLIPMWMEEQTPYHCGRRAAAVYPDGSIGPCLRDHVFKTGSIFDADPLTAIRCDTFHYDLAKSDLPDECRECAARTACQGGCPHDKLILTGTRAGRSVVCEIHKEIIPRLRRLEAAQATRRHP